jgi:hypothetical protein
MQVHVCQGAWECASECMHIRGAFTVLVLWSESWPTHEVASLIKALGNVRVSVSYAVLSHILGECMHMFRV